MKKYDGQVAHFAAKCFDSFADFIHARPSIKKAALKFPKSVQFAREFRKKLPRTWDYVPNELPWFDQENALKIIHQSCSSGKISSEEFDLLKHWIEHGYVILKDAVPETDIDEMNVPLDNLWVTEAVLPVTLFNVTHPYEDRPFVMTHGEIVPLPPEVKKPMQTSNWRIHGFNLVNKAAGRIYENQRLQQTVDLIFSRSGTPVSSVNFMYGSEHAIHDDMAAFHIFPHNHLIGAWIACEDISPDSGPLFFYPGSHQERLWKGFSDYPQTNLRTATPDLDAAYHRAIENISEKYQTVSYLPKKGDVLLWHSMLLHGGDPVIQKGLTRKSNVIHYVIREYDRIHDVVGPFNW